MPCAPARNAPGNRSLVELVGMSFGDSSFLLLAAFSAAAPLALLALRCSPALWPLGSLRESSATGIAHRSAVQPQPLRLALVRGASRVAIGPLPCPAPSDAIRAPRPSFRRSSMTAVPAASGSFRVANRDILSATNRTPSRWKINPSSAATDYRSPSITSIVAAA